MLKSIRKPKKENESSLAKGANSLHGSVANIPAAFLPGKSLIPPPEQLQLTPAQLDEEFTRILNANNPYAPQNISRWSSKEKTYKTLPNGEHTIIHFEYDGYMIYKEGSAGQEDEEKPSPSAQESTDQKDQSATAQESSQTVENAVEEKKVITASGSTATTKNQFTSCQRASQTPHIGYRERSTNTEPPPLKTFSDSVNQWIIYDAYMEELQNRERSKEKNKKKDENGLGSLHSFQGTTNFSAVNESLTVLQQQQQHEDYRTNAEVKKICSILERMCNQNSYDEIILDYKYWEDAADEFREGKGILLPLWQFVYDKEKKKQVTSIAWHVERKDLFAAGFGCYDFNRQGPGFIACFSLKNPAYPEYILKTAHGVMCCKFHPKKTSLLAAGLYDGSCVIFDLSSSRETPIYRTDKNAKAHKDSIWEIQWQENDMEDRLNFLTASTDGKITQWTLLKSELVPTVLNIFRDDRSYLKEIIIMTNKNVLGMPERLVESKETIYGATCFDICKFDSSVFIVGTDTGKLFKCSKAYNSEYLQTFEGHQLGVYAIKYSPFNANVFVTSSADWTIKIWDHDIQRPVLTFDIGQSVGDIGWSPISSTIFAAVTSDGRVIVYDLNESKYDPVCEQAVTKKSKLTHLSFSQFHPTLLVGDDSGQIMSFKLSPNLRKIGRSQETQEQKLTRLLNATLGRRTEDSA